MSLRSWLAILVGLALGLGGCMKAVERPAAPEVATWAIAPMDAYDEEDIPQAYRDRLKVSDRTTPWTFLAIASHFEARGEPGRALFFLDRAAVLFAAGRDASGEALSWVRKILVMVEDGREAEGLALVHEALKRWTSQPLRAFPEYLEGRIALMRGDWVTARERLRISLRDNRDFRRDNALMILRRDAGLAAGMTEVLSNHLPSFPSAYGGPESPGATPASEGAALLREALLLNGELGKGAIGSILPVGDLQRAEAEADAFLGLDEGMRGRAGPSLGHLIQAAELFRVAGFRQGEIQSLLFLGELGLRGINAAEGFRASAVARDRADRVRATPYRIWARLLLARYEQERGRAAEAAVLLGEADALLSNRVSVVDAEMFSGLGRFQRRAVYELLVDLLAEGGRLNESLAAAEKARALATVELLVGQDIAGNEAERELLRQEVRLGDAVRLLQRRLLRVSDEVRIGELLRKLQEAEDAHGRLLNRLAAEAPELHSLVVARGIDAASLQALLDENTTLFDYFVTDRSLFVWAVQHRGTHLERIKLARAELRTLVLSILDSVKNRGRRTGNLFRRAYDLLLKPVIPFVSGERIGFVPDDCLTYLPFAALNYRGKVLADGFSIFSLPRADRLGPAMAAGTATGMRILAFGDPDLENENLDLHHAREELAQIRRRIAQTTVLQSKQASEANAAEMAASYDILHFAVRTQFHPDAPLQSGLLLTPGEGRDGILTVPEIFRLRYSGRAVVLSGCDTLPRQDPEGRGPSALLQAFLHMGSPTVVSTLWLVDDRTAAHLLDIFYRQLERQISPSDSLRAAQLHLLREGYPAYVWAAFALTGRY
ncbi:MAG: CHAT domain-containing protein [Deltaproteobacteria bacterium]|nr:CHAT domain-containing protein [Deltaproteobacteria bacterium]